VDWLYQQTVSLRPRSKHARTLLDSALASLRALPPPLSRLAFSVQGGQCHVQGAQPPPAGRELAGDTLP